MKPKLTKDMTEKEFDNGYWYATEIKDFALSLGFADAGKLRKDELEKAIKRFLKTGKVGISTKRSLKKAGIKDTQRGLRLALPVVNYTSDRQTKDFIVAEAQKISPGLRERSGVRYRLNRWREEQLTKGRKITYRDLVNQYIKLNQDKKPFKKVPTGRYINFLSEFLGAEKNATHAQAIRAWKKLKSLDIPKTYKDWKKVSGL